MVDSNNPTSGPDPIPMATAVSPPAPAGRPAPAIPSTVIVHSARGTFARLVSWLGWAGFMFCLLLLLLALSDYFDTSQGIQERFHSGEEFGGEKVAIIHVSGVIMEGDGFVKRQIDRIRDDENVKAVILRVESPGGTVTGSDYMYHYLTQLRKDRNLPIVVSMGSIATSGGYYVAMAVGDQEKSIYAEPTCTTGSIGVIIPHYDISGLLARFDVKDDSIATHPRKQMLSMTRPMSEEDKVLIKGYIDESFSRFKEIVLEGRPGFRDDPGKLDELATGEVFTAFKAKENGLVDEIGFIEDAIDRAVELAGLSKSDVRVVQFQRPTSLLSLGGMAQSRSVGSELAALLELSTPRAFYLCTTLPLLAGSSR